VLSAVNCGEILYCVYYGRISKFFWLTTLKSKIINTFKIFHMVCIRCVTKVVSTFKIHITYIVTLIKLVKLIKWVFGSQLVSSDVMHLVGFFLYIFWVNWVLDIVCHCAHGCNYCLYIFFVSWELNIIHVMLWCWRCINFSVMRLDNQINDKGTVK
jgi:hypothetical protein